MNLEATKHKNEENNNSSKKIVKEDDLENYLAKGWEIQTILPSGKIIVKK